MTGKEMTDIASNLAIVLKNISKASVSRTPELRIICQHPRLVGVTKTKPKMHVIEAYKEGQRHFGENYVQELLEKANDEEVLAECPNIKWHMIGPLQSNKVKKIISAPNLFTIETIHNEKIANEVNKRWGEINIIERFNIFLQVNTSREKAKSGIYPEDVVDLYLHVMKNCPHLKLLGLMTIGALDHVVSLNEPNPDFQVLIKCREEVCEKLSLEPSLVELSMGMSNDYEHAIEVGSTNVRVGSLIFGRRAPKLP